MKRLLTAVAVTVLLAGCASETEEPTEQPVAPETQTLTVTLNDELPLDVYFNLDDVECHAGQLGDTEIQPPEIVIEDGSGNVLATADGPEIGGSNSDTGCTVDIEVTDVPVSDIYVVTVNSSTGESWEESADTADVEIAL